MKTLLGLLNKYNPVRIFLVMFKNLRFKNKLFLSYIIVIIIPIITLGYYSYTQYRDFLFNEGMQGLGESVRQLAANLNYKLTLYDKISKFIVFNNQIIQVINNQDPDYFKKYANITYTIDPLTTTILGTNSDMVNVVIYTNNNNLVERMNSIRKISRIQNKSWYNEVMASRQLEWVVEDHQLSGYYRFMELSKESPLNLLCIEMDYNKVFDISVNKVKEYGIVISDNDNNILYSKNMITNNKLANVDSQISSFQSGKTKINGVDCVLIREKINETGWNLSFYSPVNSVEIDASKIVVATLIVILCCIGVLILITIVFSNTFVKRIRKLNQKMKIVEEGNLQIDVNSSSKDEIGELTNSFGRMLKKINNLIDDVYHSKIIQKEAELKALQAQINPHFLYNTLSLINWKAITIDAMEISNITTNVSKFYRTILNNGKNTISVKDEIANTKSYIEIQLALHKNSFDVDYQLNDNIFNYDMINITLQPIVENAIMHGIDQKREGRGKLTICAFIVGKCLFFRIEDNGPGMDREKLDTALLQNKGGYGLMNIQERLKVFFGEGYGISIESELGSGTSVTVKIPKYNV